MAWCSVATSYLPHLSLPQRDTAARHTQWTWDGTMLLAETWHLDTPAKVSIFVRLKESVKLTVQVEEQNQWDSLLPCQYSVPAWILQLQQHWQKKPPRLHIFILHTANKSVLSAKSGVPFQVLHSNTPESGIFFPLKHFKYIGPGCYFALNTNQDWIWRERKFMTPQEQFALEANNKNKKRCKLYNSKLKHSKIQPVEHGGIRCPWYREIYLNGC